MVLLILSHEVVVAWSVTQIYLTIKDIPKSLHSEGYYSQNGLADHDLDSWELVDYKDLAATEQSTIPMEYEEF